MGEKVLASKSERLVSLDVFRGITIAGMILVNNPGTWGSIYAPLRHAAWDGWTPTDLVFPFFLFMVGVAMTYSFDKRLAQGQSRLRLFEQVVRRTVILFLLGLILAGFRNADGDNFRLIGPYVLVILGLGFLFADEPPFSLGKNEKERFRKAIGWICTLGGVLFFILDWNHFQSFEPILRVPGVLQRIAVCYFFCSLIVMYCGLRGRLFWAIVLTFGYWLILKAIPAPEGVTLPAERTGALLNEWIDVKLFGRHLYGERPDPEGLLSTLPAMGTTLLGILTGNWLHSNRDRNQKAVGMFFMANILLFLGICCDYGFPINKKIWSSSYVLFTGGLALHFLAMCYWVIDIQGYKKWAAPFLVYGTNAITAYFASGIFVRILLMIKVAGGTGGEAIALRSWLYKVLFASWLSPLNASLGFALCYVALWCLLLVPLYRRKIFIKI